MSGTRVAAVTGANKGIGLAIGKSLLLKQVATPLKEREI